MLAAPVSAVRLQQIFPAACVSAAPATFSLHAVPYKHVYFMCSIVQAYFPFITARPKQMVVLQSPGLPEVSSHWRGRFPAPVASCLVCRDLLRSASECDCVRSVNTKRIDWGLLAIHFGSVGVKTSKTQHSVSVSRQRVEYGSQKVFLVCFISPTGSAKLNK